MLTESAARGIKRSVAVMVSAGSDWLYGVARLMAEFDECFSDGQYVRVADFARELSAMAKELEP